MPPSKRFGPGAFATARMPLQRRSALAPGRIDRTNLVPVPCPGGVNLPCCGLGSRAADFISREAALRIAIFVVKLHGGIRHMQWIGFRIYWCLS